MECVALDVERHHLGIADFDTLFLHNKRVVVSEAETLEGLARVAP
jgi:hypothetical protein